MPWIEATAAAVRPTPDVALRLFERYFLHRKSHLAFLAPWGKPCPTEPGEHLRAALLAHVSGPAVPEFRAKVKLRNGGRVVGGHFRIGAYCLAPGDTVIWLCFDLDGAGHAHALANSLAAALATIAALKTAGIPGYLERSGGGKGWHVWVFFAKPVPAAQARAIGLAFAPKDATLTSGEFADAESSRGIEVFPKQTKLSKKGLGNQVWLPFWHGAPDGANVFWRQNEAGDLEPYVPEDFETVAQELVERLVATIPVTPPKPTSVAGHDVWDAWRKKALAALSLDAVYEAVLTGKAASGGWFEARDPSSPSGDQNPSAGVADGTGEAERGSFHSFRDEKTISVFDYLVKFEHVSDFAAARARIAELSGVPEPSVTSPTAADVPAADPRTRVPRITIHTKECVVADQSIAALARLDGVYHRGQALVHVVRDAAKLSGVVRPAGAPHIVALGSAGIREWLTRAADFVRATDLGLIPAHPPNWLPTAIEARRQWPEIACLEAVTESPVLRPDGTILDAEGYDRETGLLLLPDTKYPAVPTTPSADDISRARDLLLDVVCDFPFQSPAHLAAWVAALLTLVARFAFFGPSPLFVVDANVRGAGKTMLADLIGIIASGRPMPRTPQAADEAEEIKRITAIALAGDRFVLIDNITRPLGSGALDTVLTGTTWSDRILGKSEKVTLPLVTVWYASGNNITLKGDTARRCLHIRLDSDLEKSEHRENFKYPNLLRHVLEQRGALVAAGLTLLRGYCAAGRPAAGLKPWGSFEGWSGLVRGAVVWAGLADPGETRAELEQVDTDANVLADLVMGWEELPDELGTCGCTIAQALEALRDAPGPRRFARLRSALAEVCPHPPDQLPTAKKVGYALRRFRGRVVQGRKLQTRLCEGNNLWFVERVGGTSPPTPPADTLLPGLKEFDDVLLPV